MRTAAKAGIGIGAAVVVVGGIGLIVGPRIYADQVNSTADDAPTLASTAAPLEDPATAEGEWTIADGSYAGYRVDEVLGGEDVTVTGRTEDVTGTVTVADAVVTEASITVDMASVATDETRRDEYFRGPDALDTETHPEATFELTDPVELDPGTTAVDLTGDLTVHGVTRPATFEAELAEGEAGAGSVQVVGSVPITFGDFDVVAPDLGFVTVEEDGFVEFALQLESAA